MEIKSKVELDFLLKLKPNRVRSFWTGAKRDLESGIWFWENSGNDVNFALWSKNARRTDLYGKDKEDVAFIKRGTFAPSISENKARRDAHGYGISTICEAPSKYIDENPPPPPEPLPTPRWREYESVVTNSTYYFSEFMLPWTSAQRSCREKGGSLAEIESPPENEDLVGQARRYGRRGAWWLGARSSEADWSWHRTNRSFDQSFTDWKPNQTNASDSDCLLLMGRQPTNDGGYHWQRESCLIWQHFICEIPSNDSTTFDMSGYLGDKQCQENTYRFDGFSTTVKNCYHFVQLQLNFEQAETFCRERLNESLAKVDAAHRDKFEPLLIENLRDRDQVKHHC